MKKFSFGLLAAAVLAVVATTAFALDARKPADAAAQTAVTADNGCTGCCCSK